jgi:hypothetical protein
LDLRHRYINPESFGDVVCQLTAPLPGVLIANFQVICVCAPAMPRSKSKEKPMIHATIRHFFVRLGIIIR